MKGSYLKTPRTIFLVFAILGVVLLTPAAFLYLRTRNFVQNSLSSDGVVIGFNRGARGVYRPRVRFRSQGGESFVVVSSAGSRPPSYRIGEHVRVLYNPTDPSDARIDSFVTLWIAPFVFSVVGGIFALMGGIALFCIRTLKERREWLLANGQRIVANFDRIELNTSLRVNGKSPYRIVCQWPDPVNHRVHVFRSQNLWFNPQPYLNGNTMLVMVDPANLRRYVVDISFLPELAE